MVILTSHAWTSPEYLALHILLTILDEPGPMLLMVACKPGLELKEGANEPCRRLIVLEIVKRR